MKQIQTYAFVILIICTASIAVAQDTTSAEQPDINIVMGDWARSDGEYTLSVRNVRFDGSVDVGYFNPGEINVEKSSVSTQEGLVKLFVKLQDKGYPGSTYTLYYFAEKDALAGFYYQAVMKQSFEIVFYRKDE